MAAIRISWALRINGSRGDRVEFEVREVDALRRAAGSGLVWTRQGSTAGRGASARRG